MSNEEESPFVQGMREYAARVEMSEYEARHSLRRFIVSLSPDDKEQLHRLLQIAASSEGITHYWLGVIDGYRDGSPEDQLCFSCGKRHDDDLEKIANGNPRPEETIVYTADLTTEDGIEDFLEAYEVTVNEDGELQCDYCMHTWSSIEDRMRRKPGKGGCPVCVEKEKWG